MPSLFDPLDLRGVTLPNRVVVSPMCEYSSTDGFANEWHFVHLGSRAIGGAGLVCAEATAVLPEGRISPVDLGLWKDEHIEPLARIVSFAAAHGATMGIQLAHAGRKASTRPPFDGGGKLEESGGGWRTVAPSAVPYSADYPMPDPLDEAGITRVIAAFQAAASRALEAGFRVIEVHAAHGYLLHQFLSPWSNRRTDRWGGSFANRARLLYDVVSAIRAVWPDRLPLFVRISATEWTEGGWGLEQSVALARELRGLGVDLIDCSSGGNVAGARVPVGPGYQTGFAERIRREAEIATAAVGLITDPVQAEHVIRTGQADLVVLARELLRDPYWPLRAARALGHRASWPAQYLRAAPPESPRREPLGPV